MHAEATSYIVLGFVEKKSSDLEEKQPRRVAQADRARTGDDDEDVADAVAAVVEELPHRTGGPSAARLTKGVTGLIRNSQTQIHSQFSSKMSESLNIKI